eukprot:GILK01005605.1.p1 GENE.GILK01005605.1~~GILK01005605.1.p1  ORF type:complete len:527 (+),score=86.12 GILK01005605.1:42-1622(+)
MARSRSRETEKVKKERDTSRDGERDKGKDRKRSRERSSERSRDKDRDRHRDRDRERSSRKDRKRSRSRDRERDRDRHRVRSRSRDRRDSRSKGAERRRSRSKSRDRYDRRREDTRGRRASPEKRPFRFDSPPKESERTDLTLSGSLSLMAGMQTNAASSKSQRELYVGNLPPGIQAPQVIEFLNTALVAANLTRMAGFPVINAWLSPDNHYCFAEFRTVEEANLGLMLNGVNLLGQTLKVGRPKTFLGTDITTAQLSGVMPVPNLAALSTSLSANLASSILPPGAQAAGAGNPNKLCASGLPPAFTPEQVQALVKTFGALKDFELITDPATGKSRGYAFFEYEDPSIIDKACTGLTGLKVGDNTLVVQRANLFSGTAGLPLMGAPLGLGLPSALLSSSAPASSTFVQPPTRILLLKNMVLEQELVDTQEYEDIVEDTKEECSKHGNVISVAIPRPMPGEKVEGVGKVFVEFETEEEAQKARRALHHRKFASRVVEATFYPEDMYQAKNFSESEANEQAQAQQLSSS